MPLLLMIINRMLHSILNRNDEEKTGEEHDGDVTEYKTVGSHASASTDGHTEGEAPIVDADQVTSLLMMSPPNPYNVAFIIMEMRSLLAAILCSLYILLITFKHGMLSIFSLSLLHHPLLCCWMISNINSLRVCPPRCGVTMVMVTVGYELRRELGRKVKAIVFGVPLCYGMSCKVRVMWCGSESTVDFRKRNGITYCWVAEVVLLYL